MKGYRTYVNIAVMALFNVLQTMGMTGVESSEVVITVNVIAGISAFIFNKLGRDRLKNGGSV
jgi:hypothetical protein